MLRVKGDFSYLHTLSHPVVLSKSAVFKEMAMIRKISLLFLVALPLLGIGIILGMKLENPQGPYMRLISENVHLHQYTKRVAESSTYSYAKMNQIADEVCRHIYPAPVSIEECEGKLTHGVAKAFDPHTAYLDPSEVKERDEERSDSLEGIGVSIAKSKETIGIVVQDTLSGGVAEIYGVVAGDIILEVNGVSVSRFKNITDVAKVIRGKPGTHVVLKIKHKDIEQPVHIKLQRVRIARPQIESAILRHEGKYYGYIHAHRFESEFTKQMQDAVFPMLLSQQKLSGLIISLEGNPGGSLYEVNNALDLFMDAESFVLERNRAGIEKVIRNPFSHTHGDITDGIPMLVVVNGRSASASEIFAGAMQHNKRALIYGTKTFGKGTIQNIISLDDGSEIKVTIAEYLVGTPSDWIPIQCIGVIPDIQRKQVKVSDTLITECSLDGSITSGGPMLDPPLHIVFAESNPDHFAVGLHMIGAFEMHRKKK